MHTTHCYFMKHDTRSTSNGEWLDASNVRWNRQKRASTNKIQKRCQKGSNQSFNDAIDKPTGSIKTD